MEENKIGSAHKVTRWIKFLNEKDQSIHLQEKNYENISDKG